MPTKTQTELPKLCEMRISGLVQCQGVRVIVVNPAQGLVVPLVDPKIVFLSPSSPVTHWGNAEYGTFITWKPFGESDQPQLNPAFERSVRTTAIPGGSEAA